MTLMHEMTLGLVCFASLACGGTGPVFAIDPAPDAGADGGADTAGDAGTDAGVLDAGADVGADGGTETCIEGAAVIVGEARSFGTNAGESLVLSDGRAVFVDSAYLPFGGVQVTVVDYDDAGVTGNRTTIVTPGANGITDLQVLDEGHFAGVVRSFPSDWLQIFSVEADASVIELGTIALTIWHGTIAAIGDTLVACTTGRAPSFSVYDVSNRRNPRLVTTRETVSGCSDLALEPSGDRVWKASAVGVEGFETATLTRGAALLTGKNATALALDNGWLAVAHATDRFGYQRQVSLIELETLSVASELRVDPFDGPLFRDVALDGGILIAATADPGGPQVLGAYQMESAVELGEWIVPGRRGENSVVQLQFAHGILTQTSQFAAEYSASILKVNPASSAVILPLEWVGQGSISRTPVIGRTAYALGVDRVHVLDLSDFRQPRWIVSHPLDELVGRRSYWLAAGPDTDRQNFLVARGPVGDIPAFGIDDEFNLTAEPEYALPSYYAAVSDGRDVFTLSLTREPDSVGEHSLNRFVPPGSEGETLAADWTLPIVLPPRANRVYGTRRLVRDSSGPRLAAVSYFLDADATSESFIVLADHAGEPAIVATHTSVEKYVDVAVSGDLVAAVTSDRAFNTFSTWEGEFVVRLERSGDALVETGRVRLPGTGEPLYFRESLAVFMTERGLTFIDMSAATPRVIDEIALPSMARSIELVEGHLIVTTTSGIYVVVPPCT